MDNQNTPVQPQNELPPQQTQYMNTEQHYSPQPPKSHKKTILIIILVVILLAVIGLVAAWFFENSKANAYIEESQAFGASTAVSQLESALTEFESGNNGLYSDMFYCRATSEDTIGVIERNGVSYFSNEAVLSVLNDYKSSHEFLVQNAPKQYSALPLVGLFGSSKEAQQASEEIQNLLESSSQLETINDHSAYCLNDLYGMLSGHVPYIEDFADENVLADQFTSGATEAEQKLEALTTFKSYNVNSYPEGFDKVHELRDQFLSQLEVSLTSLKNVEQSDPGFALALGTQHTGFQQLLNTFDDSIITEASNQAEKYITVDTGAITSSINSVKSL